MDLFNKVHIDSVNGDISLRDGNHLSIINASYRVCDGCLYIETISNDVRLTIPSKQLEEVSVHTVSGDCFIEFDDLYVKTINFDSTNGDLNVFANYDVLSFNSIAGECEEHKKVSKKPSKVTKTITKAVDDNSESWIDGERYR